VAGLMPHPERRMVGEGAAAHGRLFFQSLAAWLAGEREASPLTFSSSILDRS
jgi:hypothetical protein